MTDTADYLLSRITETSVSMEWNDIAWKAGLALLTAGLALVLVGKLMERRHGDDYHDMDCGVMLLGMGVAIFGAITALIGYVGMLQDQDILTGLVASYEALYGPLPEGVL